MDTPVTAGTDADPPGRRVTQTHLARWKTSNAAESRRRRRTLIFLSTIAAGVLGWFVVPTLRMLALDRTIRQLKDYREATGRFPVSALELAAALHGETTVTDAMLGTEPEFGGYTWDDMGVHYTSDATGSWFELRFNHPWFVYDTGRFDYDTVSDGWGHWYD